MGDSLSPILVVGSVALDTVHTPTESATDVLGGVVAGCGFLVELAFLGGRARLAPRETHALLSYEA